MSHSESYGYLIIRITGSFLDLCLGTLDCSRTLLTRNSRGPSRTVLDFGLKGRIPTFCLVLWLVPLLSIGPSRDVDSVRDTQSLPLTSRGQELFAATGGRFSASPIDYEASARRIVEENPDDVELQTVLGFPPPTTAIVKPPPRVPSPVADVVDNIENIHPVPVICLPP